jgi:hypothetical protein
MNGTFYLIHPYENLIKRNIINNIIKIKRESKNIPINHIPPSEYKFFLRSLKDSFSLSLAQEDYLLQTQKTE